ncbi:MAG: hypothetical protein ACOY46_15620 [Bacillota bacterium]
MSDFYLTNINPEELEASTKLAKDRKLQMKSIDYGTLAEMYPIGVNIEQKITEQVKKTVISEPKQEDAPVSKQDIEEDKAALKQEGLPVPEDSMANVTGEKKADPDDPLKKGKMLHKMALSGDKKAAWESYMFFLRSLESKPDDPVVKAFHADCLSMVERYSNSFPQEPFKLYNPLTAPCRVKQHRR